MHQIREVALLTTVDQIVYVAKFKPMNAKSKDYQSTVLDLGLLHSFDKIVIEY